MGSVLHSCGLRKACRQALRVGVKTQAWNRKPRGFRCGCRGWHEASALIVRALVQQVLSWHLRLGLTRQLLPAHPLRRWLSRVLVCVTPLPVALQNRLQS